MELNFNQKLAAKLLTDQLVYHVAGFMNAVMDETMEQSELDDEMSFEGLQASVEYFFSKALKEGYVDSPYTNTVVEAKHLKFGGMGRIELLKNVAVANAFIRLRKQGE